MFFQLYWSYFALGIALYISYRLFSYCSKNYQKTVLFSSGDVKTRDQTAEIKETDDDVQVDEEDWLPSLGDIDHVPLSFDAYTAEESLNKSEEYFRLMNKRRTVRHFSSKPVPKEVIANIIKTAGTAPSGAHTEPWTFVVISSMEMKSRIRELIEEEEEINYKKRMGKVWTTDLSPLRTNWVKDYLTEAPYLIMVFKQTYSFRRDGKKRMHYYNEQSVCIAAGILLTAIHYAGLVSLTSTPLNCGPSIRSLLGRPMSEKLALLLPVGYPSEKCLIPDLKRKPLQDILIEF